MVAKPKGLDNARSLDLPDGERPVQSPAFAHPIQSLSPCVCVGVERTAPLIGLAVESDASSWAGGGGHWGDGSGFY